VRLQKSSTSNWRELLSINKFNVKGGDNMPKADGTGPLGNGPMTGRGAGFCAGNEVPGYANATGLGRGFIRGGGHSASFEFKRGSGHSASFGFKRGSGKGAGLGLRRGVGCRAGVSFRRGNGTGFGFKGSGKGAGLGLRRAFSKAGLPGWVRLGRRWRQADESDSPVDEKEFLRKQEAILEKQLEELRKRLEGIDKEVEEDEK
jgi:hypothetical protein